MTMVTQPNMSGLHLFGTGNSAHIVAWNGGAPNAKWTSLEDPNATCDNPCQTRSMNPEAKYSYRARQAGMFPGEESQKFAHGDDLDYFCRSLQDALKDMGMDTVGYRRDPLDPTKMIDVLTQYPRLSKSVMKVESAWCLPKYDSYDTSNDRQAKRFLLASLSADLKKKIHYKSGLYKSGRTDPCFVDVLFVLIEYERPLSIDASQAMVDAVRAMTPSQFPGENITLFVEAIRPKLAHLEIGRSWDSMNNPALCRTLALAGGGSNYEYNSELYSLLNKLQDECQYITHLTNQEKVVHMASKSLGWKNIFDIAESHYVAQVVPGRIRWPPACH